MWILRLSLALLYLTSWDEPGFDKGETIYRSEKRTKKNFLQTYIKKASFITVDKLNHYVSEEGIEKVKLLLEQLNIQKQKTLPFSDRVSDL